MASTLNSNTVQLQWTDNSSNGEGNWQYRVADGQDWLDVEGNELDVDKQQGSTVSLELKTTATYPLSVNFLKLGYASPSPACITQGANFVTTMGPGNYVVSGVFANPSSTERFLSEAGKLNFKISQTSAA